MNKRNIDSYFNGLLENINIIMDSTSYLDSDKINLKYVKEKIEKWYAFYKKENTLKNIEIRELENIGFEITDLFDKYIALEPVKENYIERLLYDFSGLEEYWKKEIIRDEK